MSRPETPKLGAVLSDVMASYGKPMPEDFFLKSWQKTLASFPMEVVAQAFSTYCDQEPNFVPTPVKIAAICKTMDGRPGAEEAWSMSLVSRDESNTVIWTEEMAVAFIMTAPLLKKDEVGARMAFREKYNGLVSQARAAGIPARWTVSPGRDQNQVQEKTQAAIQLGRLPAPKIDALQMLQGVVAPLNQHRLESVMAGLTVKTIAS